VREEKFPGKKDPGTRGKRERKGRGAARHVFVRRVKQSEKKGREVEKKSVHKARKKKGVSGAIADLRQSEKEGRKANGATRIMNSGKKKMELQRGQFLQ